MKKKLNYILSVFLTAYLMLSVFFTGVLFGNHYENISALVENIRLITLDYNFTTTQLLFAIMFTMITTAIPLVMIVRKLHILPNVEKIG